VSENNQIVNEILSVLDNHLEKSGINRIEAWEKGWGEILIEFSKDRSVED
jgi:hypothetical protein